MKKILYLLIIAPLTTFAQLRVPNFPVDSVSGHIQYHAKFDFPGVDRKKIFDVMMDWFSTNGSRDHPSIIGEDTGTHAFTALLTGTSDPTNTPIPVTTFMLHLTVTDGLAVITITDFEISNNGETEPLETFRDRVKTQSANQTHITLPGASAKDMQKAENTLTNWQIDLLDNVSQTADRVLREVGKFVKKAQKKHLI